MSSAVQIPAEFDDWVEEQVQSGRHASSAEVVRAALEFYRARAPRVVTTMEELRELIQVGLADERAGRVRDDDASLRDDIISGRIRRPTP